MPSINDISIAVNSLFLDIINPMTLGLNKLSFFNNHPNTIFRQDNRFDFEFQVNPVFRFDDKESLIGFLEKENVVSKRFQDHSFNEELGAMLNDVNGSLTLEDFFLDYTIETNDNETIIVFNTNSMIFKYEVIG